MNHTLLSLASLSMLFLGACTMHESEEAAADTSAAVSSDDSSWDCYAPEPGHPTAWEQQRFIQTKGLAALKAERTYGVPASAILAMAAVEGGFGFTRTALYAKNSFGYKYVTASSAGWRPSYTLACQPDWDVGNQYIVFDSIEESILFVAWKLANRTDVNYKAATDRYRAARRSDPDADPSDAVNDWIDGIADAGYNYDPPTYKRTIKRAIAQNDLYRFSASAIPGASSAAP